MPRVSAVPIPALQGLDPGERTIYVGSFSKVMYPSLGIGYVVVPHPLIDAFRNVLSAAGRPPSKVDQIALAEFIEEGHFARHLRRMRIVHEGRRTALVESIHAHSIPNQSCDSKTTTDLPFLAFHRSCALSSNQHR